MVITTIMAIACAAVSPASRPTETRPATTQPSRLSLDASRIKVWAYNAIYHRLNTCPEIRKQMPGGLPKIAPSKVSQQLSLADAAERCKPCKCVPKAWADAVKDSYIPDLRPPFSVGQHGCLEHDEGTLVQVIGPTEAIVRVDYSLEVDSTPSGYAVGRVYPVMRTEVKSTTVWLRGVSTKGLVTDGRIPLPKHLKVSQTKTYETTAGGTNTVFVLEPGK